MRPHRQQPIRLPGPWDSPGKNTRVGCHFLLQCMKVKSESEVDQSCPTRSDPMDCSPSGSSVHGIFQARVREWGATAFSQWIWVWVNSGSWWWTGRPRVLWFMGSQRVGHNWVTELNFDLTIPVLWKFTLKIGFQNMKIHVNKFINCSNICNDKILKTIWCPNQGYWLSKLWWNGKFYSLE